MQNVIIIIPTYDERENIQKMIPSLFQLYPEVEILVVDDNSPDQTAKIVKNFQKKYPKLYLLEREKKEGLGKAYLAGFNWTLTQTNCTYMIQLDADFSHPLEKIIDLYQITKDNQGICVGSRYVKGGDVKGWDLKRLLLSKGGALYVRCILQLPVLDPTAGFVCYHRRVLETIPLNEITWVGYSFQIAMKYYAYCLNFKITETPIAFVDRVWGHSKMSMAIFKEALIGVWQMRQKIRKKRKYFIWNLIFLFLFFLNFSCSDNIAENSILKNRLSLEKMAEIIYDLHQTEEYAKIQFMSDTSLSEFQKDQLLILEYLAVFEKHQIESNTFEQNFEHYSQDSYQMKEIYEYINQNYLKE